LILPPQILDDGLRLDLFLDVDRRGVDFERIGLKILAAPDQLRIEIGIARPAQFLDGLVVVGDELLVLGGRNVLPFRFSVAIRLDVGVALLF
jgi:hypothetical protein